MERVKLYCSVDGYPLGYVGDKDNADGGVLKDGKLWVCQHTGQQGHMTTASIRNLFMELQSLINTK